MVNSFVLRFACLKVSSVWDLLWSSRVGVRKKRVVYRAVLVDIPFLFFCYRGIFLLALVLLRTLLILPLRIAPDGFCIFHRNEQFEGCSKFLCGRSFEWGEDNTGETYQHEKRCTGSHRVSIVPDLFSNPLYWGWASLLLFLYVYIILSSIGFLHY